jgi:putative methyltransferase (TIGR04325 family)
MQQSFKCATYEEAQQESSFSGYEGEDLVASVVERNRRYRHALWSNNTLEIVGAARTIIGVALALKGKTRLRILDFGGGGGNHYSIAKVMLGLGVHLDWTVVESHAMAAASRKVENSELRFFDSISAATKIEPNYDLVFTSGALQYCPNPIGIARELFNVGAPFVFVTRTAFSQAAETIFGVQVSTLSGHGPGAFSANWQDRYVQTPLVLSPLTEFECCYTDLGYKCRFKLLEDANAYVLEGVAYNMFGYFCEK